MQAAWGGRLREPRIGSERRRVGSDGSRGSDGGVGVCARNGQTILY